MSISINLFYYAYKINFNMHIVQESCANGSFLIENDFLHIISFAHIILKQTYFASSFLSITLYQ